MKNLEEMMKKMQGFQESLEASVVTGQSGGGLVALSMNGKGEMKEIKIDPSLLVPGEREILEDLIVAAHGEAKRKIDDLQVENVQKMASNFPLPPGFKLPS